MSATGLEVFDRTLQTTNTWLGEIMRDLDVDRHVAWKVLSVVLHKLRDRLPVDLAAHLGSQLPMLVRGVFYDQYQPARQPTDCRTLEEFASEVDQWLSDTRPLDPQSAVQAVFRVLSHHVPEGQLEKVRGALPSSIRSFWEGLEGGETRRRPEGGTEAAAEI
jgi:uncharacterized protein (DUF2267 family)